MVLVWLYSLNTNKDGNYVKKAMRDCTGEEVCREWAVPHRRTGGLGQQIRRARAAARLLLRHRQEADQRGAAILQGEGAAEARCQEDQGHQR